MSVSPTFGFKITTLMHDSFQLHFWDIGGQRTIRPYWRNYFEETDGLVFVIDSAAVLRLGEALEELKVLLGQDRLANASLLILANKQDCPGAINELDIKKQLGLVEALGTGTGKTSWKLVGCSAIDEKDPKVTEALEWLVEDIANRLYHRTYPINPNKMKE